MVVFLLPVLSGCGEQGSQPASTRPSAGVESTPGEESASAEVQQRIDAQAEAAAAAEARRKAEQAQMQAQQQASEAYLHINAQKPNVKVLESGLQFEIIESGEGASPGSDDRVVVHYHGTLVNGDVFDSSLERGQPATLPVNRVIRGWQQALPMMKEGDTWKLVIPPDLAYGAAGAGGGRIPPHATLIFEVELIEVKN